MHLRPARATLVLQACTTDGTTYEITNILPYIRKFHKHPVSGAPLSIKDIVPLRFHKNVEGQFSCPVLSKVFTAHTHIVAIKTSGNVFCWEVGNPSLCSVPKT